MLVLDVFRHRFPSHYELHSKIVNFLVTSLGLPNPFGVFTSVAVNTGGQVCMDDHTDPNNLAGSFCGVMSFGNINFRKSAFLVIKVGGMEYRFELPPGIPIFFPSALLLHSNSKIIGSDGYRGSIVYWMAGSVARWYMLNGRAVNQLSDVELKEWQSQARLRQHRNDVLALYPIVKTAS